ncbi:uncharacterized protein LOC125710118 [Brienomyrus brachyistius]|uniref:uncharacterized protein LOC125710118 n=1 Tax=Brienomyrus brachyistius TaxID=42636 RepID=UPI0020B3649C|nr:uncharacterized protein LOC125710118 [Brienomyrus brachyistius]
MACRQNISVIWCKLDLSNMCRTINEPDRIQWNASYSNAKEWVSGLHFTSTLVNDSGNYRCKTVGEFDSISHSINVIVTDAPVEVSTRRPQNKNSTIILRNKDWLLYVYISVGIVIFTFLVMGISCFIVQRRQGSKQSATVLIPQYQHEEGESCKVAPQPEVPPRMNSLRTHSTPTSEVPVYDIPTNRRMSQKRNTKASVRRPLARTCTPDKASVGLCNNESAGETPELNHVVYATLNHQPAQQDPDPVRTSRSLFETCEYAPIRVH